MRDETEQRKPEFIAFVYPGWHATAYRGGVDEWQLLDNFTPYFDGHLPPLQPLGGRYDDALPETARKQIDMALSYGINGFLYFGYYGAQRWVMDAPMRRALENAPPGRFGVAASWCIRLPHDGFPVPARDALEFESRSSNTATTLEQIAARTVDNTPIEQASLADLEHLLPADDPIWAQQQSGLHCAAADSLWHKSPTPRRAQARDRTLQGVPLGQARQLLQSLAALAVPAALNMPSLGALQAVVAAEGLGHLPLESVIALYEMRWRTGAPAANGLSAITLKELGQVFHRAP